MLLLEEKKLCCLVQVGVAVVVGGGGSERNVKIGRVFDGLGVEVFALQVRVHGAGGHQQGGGGVWARGTGQIRAEIMFVHKYLCKPSVEQFINCSNDTL
ncbi:hypothetical protein BpHYR1_006914 [Brachionus plicatilis]|uniref:Uncharacterized protein n=1 Tax=Brachionus plicatilis TaxID=10195 RepID=A0A3M7QRX4_BRAPC|nr:hypothetical protein BpHYR1_006914 [Brachionus plicatilis]